MIIRPIHKPGWVLLALAALLCLSLTGCAVLDPGPAPARVQLFPKLPPVSTQPPAAKQLVVEMPTSGRDLATDSIALSFKNREVRYLAGYRWTDTAPAVFRRALLDALQANGGLQGVADENAGISADARLISDIKQFHLRYDDPNQAPTAEISVAFQLINLRDGTIMAAKVSSAKQKAAGPDQASLIQAFETALSAVLADAAPWVETQMRQLK